MKCQIGGLKFSFFFRWASAWVGVHYSRQHEAYCICLLPFCVIRITFAKNDYKYEEQQNISTDDLGPGVFNKT